MSSPAVPPSVPGSSPVGPHFPGLKFLRAVGNAFRSRIVSGLIVALPIALTFGIIYQLYLFFNGVLNAPIQVVRWLLGLRFGFEENSAWLQLGSPLVTMALVLGLVYLLGFFARSWVHRTVDWILLHVPIVTTIYSAVRSIFQSIDIQLQGNSFKRVVLVPYPHEGARVLGFVTKTLSDATTGAPIVCVCILTGTMPPAGITLFLPEDKVTDVDWSVNQAIQAIVSGGIAVPSVIHYSQGIDVPPTGPILDRTGHPITHPHTTNHQAAPQPLAAD